MNIMDILSLKFLRLLFAMSSSTVSNSSVSGAARVTPNTNQVLDLLDRTFWIGHGALKVSGGNMGSLLNSVTI